MFDSENGQVQSAGVNSDKKQCSLNRASTKPNEKVFEFLSGARHACIAAGIVLVSACAAYAESCVYPPPGLVSWWPAEGNANDTFGGNPGIITNGPSFATGMVGQAFSFNGVDDIVTGASAHLIDIQNTFTIEFWAFPLAARSSTSQSTSGTAGTSGQRYAVAPYDGGSGPAGAGVSVGTNGISVFEHASSYLPSLLVYNASITNWTHVAVVYENKQPKLYVNGVLVKTGLASQRSGVFPSKAFGNVNNYGPFKGLLDEVSIYNRALSSNEVRSIYNAGSDGKCPPAVPSGVIYANDFEGPVSLEWSTTNTATSPWGNRRFLGKFGNQAVTLTRSNLAPHTSLTATFDLFILDTWDGNVGGPDVWEVSVVGGPILLHTTFQNYRPRQLQAYPDGYPGGFYRAKTGALESDTLGYSPDAVYRLNFTFPHSSNVMKLQFRGVGLQAVTDESWGLDNVMIFADGPVVALTSLTNGATFRTPTNLVLTADALAPSGTIKYVQFLSDHVLLGTVTNNGFSMVWTNVPAGLHVVTVRATDDSGRTGESSAAIRVNGLTGEYFNNTSFSGAPVTRLDPAIDFDWLGSPPIQGVPGTNFSARWTGQIEARFSELYNFYVSGDDGFRLWVDGRRIADDGWVGGNTHTRQGSILLATNRTYSVQLDYYQGPGGSDILLEWASSSEPRQTIPARQLFPPEPGVNRPPNAPVVLLPGADGWVVDWTADLTMSVDMFSDPDTGQTPAEAGWEIWTVTPSNLVWFNYTTNAALFLSNRLSNGTFTNSHTGFSHLQYFTDYRLRMQHMDNSTNASGVWAERIFNTRPPVVTRPPQGYNSILGENVNLSVAATNISPVVSYQWYLNSNAMINATNAALLLPNIQPEQAGNYTVEVRNLAGSNISVPASVTIDSTFLPLVQNSFNTNGDLEGWVIVEPGGNPPVTLRYGTNLGNPSGAVYGTESGNGGTFYFLAPTNFLGNKSGSYGGYLEFQQRRTSFQSPFAAPGIILSGNGYSLVFDVTNFPGADWTHYRIPLFATNGWHWNNLQGSSVTNGFDFLRVLSSLTSLQIRGEYNTGADTCYLDNVRLLARECVADVILLIRRPTESTAIVEWPTNACGFQLESADHLNPLSWSTNFSVAAFYITNGLNVLIVPTTIENRFYRLKQLDHQWW